MDWTILLTGADLGITVKPILEEAQRLGRLAVDAFKTADQVLGPTFRFLGALVAFFSGVIAIYLKFHYAESRLHLRFQEFLEREENRLALANKHLDATVKRPGPGRDTLSPIFLASDLRPQLREMEWGALTLRHLLRGRATRADRELKSAISELEQQLALWNLQKSCYERKKAQAHLVRGAIAATRAARRKARREDDRDENLIALGECKAATGVEPQKLQAFEDGASDAFERVDIQALEYVGHMHFRLGNPTLALRYFEKCKAVADKMGAKDLEAPLLRVRALRHQAEVLEWQNIEATLQQARSRITDALGALPSERIDSIDGAELYELRARVQRKRFQLDAITAREARRDYTQAEQRYARIDTPEAKLARDRVKKDRDTLPPDVLPTDGPGASPA